MNNIEAAREIMRIAKDLLGYDFPNQKELVKYLHEHPRANPSNHKVIRNPKRLPKQLKNPEKHKEYTDLEHKDLDKDKVKKIRKRLKKLKDKAEKAPKEDAKKTLKAPSIEEVTPKGDDKPVDEKKQKSLEKRRYTLSKNKHMKNYANYNFDADPGKKESPWKNMDWDKYSMYAKNATHVGHSLLNEHDFDEDAMKDIREVRKNKFGRSQQLSPAEIKSKYMDNMNPKNFKDAKAFQAAKERIQKMPPTDFLIVFRSILDEEKDENDVVENMKNIQDNQESFLNKPQYSGEKAHKTW